MLQCGLVCSCLPHCRTGLAPKRARWRCTGHLHAFFSSGADPRSARAGQARSVPSPFAWCPSGFWHSGIAHLQVRSAASRSADPAAAQPTRGRRAPTAGHRQHSDRCIFCLLLASMSATAGHMPCHYATGKAICHALSRTGVGRDCCTLVVVCWHVELGGLQWFAVVCSGLGLG